MVTKMGSVSILKAFFGTEKPLTSQELIDFKKNDPKGFMEVVKLAAKQLGVEIEVK